MLVYNSLIINGKSTADFPFFVGVTENSPPAKANKKNKLFEHEHANGIQVREVNAYEPITKRYKFYLYKVTKSQIREFKTFIGYRGWFTPYDENDVKYYYEQVNVEFDVLDEVNGYEVTVEFTCQPFAYESEQTIILGSTITNHTNAPMYPKIKIIGSASRETFLQIGNQKVVFTEIQDEINLECKHGFQNAWASGGRNVNHQMKGEFFEILPGTHPVIKGSGIREVEMLCRWGWL